MSTFAKDTEAVGQFLIAMPGLQDPRFQKTVILICEYSKTAVMGLILNKQIYNLTLGKILSHQKKENAKNNCFNEAIFSGGPVHTKQGFILHSNEKLYNLLRLNHQKLNKCEFIKSNFLFWRWYKTM